MNIVQALNAALPELPERVAQRSFPKLDPRMIAKEHRERGKDVVLAKLPGSDNFLTLSLEQWKLLKLFDGQRSYEEIAEDFHEMSGETFTEDEVREFSSFLMENANVFYKTPLEKSIALSNKVRSGCLKGRRFKLSDVADIQIHQWPNADGYLTRIHPYLKWIYTRWCTLLTLGLFALMTLMWVAKFGEIWRDSFQFYNFTSKTLRDLVEFWFLFGAMAAIHETAHGLTCKHFGANVEKMGFMLMYFAPTFYCDVTQIWIHGGRFERLCTVIAGIWSDFIVCAFATFVWWSTATGMLIHDFAYKIMMVTGIGVTIANLNPLIKLDGYYMFAEITGESDLKERSTLYLSAWVRKHIFKMPAELEYVRRSRRLFYIIYAIVSGLYGYALITFFVLFTHNVFRNYIAEWAFVPALVVAALALRSRSRTCGRFLRMLYLDKKERVRAWFTPLRLAIVTAAIVLLLFVPIWPDFVAAKCTLEPYQRAVVRAQVPGEVTAVFAAEGQFLASGAPILQLRNFDLESRASRARAELQIASAKLAQGELTYVGYGPARREQERLVALNRALTDQLALLDISAPISGTVLTPRLKDLQNSYFSAGTLIAELGDLSVMVARVYVPEFEVRDLRVGASTRILVGDRLVPFDGKLIEISPANETIESDLLLKDQLSGVRPPRFYAVKVRIQNPGFVRPQMTAEAKIFIARRSLAAVIFRFARDTLQRRLW